MSVPNGITHRLSQEAAIRTVALVEDRTQCYVANLLSVDGSTIFRLMQKYHTTGSVNRKLGQGRKRKTSQRDDRFLRFTGLRTRHCTQECFKKRFQAPGCGAEYSGGKKSLARSWYASKSTCQST
ncbi:hypothetical protein Zmor_010883 [Zophobas morio]|uniref:Uncharacterized protein n=1 Tax=Zophobas morio TaxID=2755281 RepID=A0AA38MJ55_9CUCU|nr:hypothetical protein Zmor_010883 [Zophobas morio]